MTPLDAALEYYRRGWRVVPIPTGIKRPVIEGWRDLILTADDLPRYFGANQNLGIRLGAASNGLVDIDLDCREALLVADLYLPVTKANSAARASRFRIGSIPLPVPSKRSLPTLLTATCCSKCHLT